jgi:hypothetical protein
MKNLQQEAEEYAQKVNINLVGKRIQHKDKNSVEDFMAGAKSNWVQAEKIKAQIDILRKHRLSGEEKFSDTIEELEQHLREFEVK